MSDEKQLHWLVRPSTIRKLWIGSGIVLALTVIVQTVIYVKGYFGFDAFFGFGAFYGFGSCLVMVLVAKVLGFVLKRPEDYYAEPAQDSESESSDNKIKEHNNGA